MRTLPHSSVAHPSSESSAHLNVATSASFGSTTRLIRITEVVALVGLARATIYKLMSQPESGFPQAVKLTDSTARGAPVAWVLSEVQSWVESRIEARDQVAA